MTPDKRRQAGQSGNALMIVLIGVVLFAALMFTFSRSARQGGENIGNKQLDLRTSDVTDYAQEVERAVGRVLARGLSESQLSFANAQQAGYTNAADCGEDRCRVFTPAGGALVWEPPPPQANDGSPWLITGANAVPDVGDDADADLLLILPHVRADLCARLNDTLRVPNPGGAPPADGDGIDVTKFTGAFGTASRIGDAADIGGRMAACVESGGDYYFYSVLLDR